VLWARGGAFFLSCSQSSGTLASLDLSWFLARDIADADSGTSTYMDSGSRISKTLPDSLALMSSTPRPTEMAAMKGTLILPVRLSPANPLSSFVEFETAADLRTAVEKLDGREFKNSRVTCVANVRLSNAEIRSCWLIL
jgi:hypothetical protein